MKVWVNLVECQNCHRRVGRSQVVTILERKNKKLTGRSFRLCFDCRKKFHILEIKNAEVSKDKKLTMERVLKGKRLYIEEIKLWIPPS